MFEEKLKADLFDKIIKDANIVIFGAGDIGRHIYNDIKEQRPDVQILGFIDNYIKGNCFNLPIWSLKQFIDLNLQVNHVVMSTRQDYHVLNNIFDLYDIPVLVQTEFVSKYYRKGLNILNEKDFARVIELFEQVEDKNLYEMLYKIRLSIVDYKTVVDYYYGKYSRNKYFDFPIKSQYIEKLNKEAVTSLLDVGLNSGLNVVAFNKLLPNLKNTYGFEVIYDVVKQSYIDDFIGDKRLKVVPYALGDKETSTAFYINKINSGCSFCASLRDVLSDTTGWEEITAKVITLDKYCIENNIKPDFIKMDIEGAEMPALKGGIKTIQKSRPQLAISIYHSDNDFINIPIYLNENLKDYIFKLGHYSPSLSETVLYAIPKELDN